MSRFLLIDIGAGTMDVLYFDDASSIHYKAVAKSPVAYTAERIAAMPGNLFAYGQEMGGGPVSSALKQRAGIADVVMTASAAATVHHHADSVLAGGIKIVDDTKADAYRHNRRFSAVCLDDLDPERIEQLICGFGVPFEFDILAVCAQDHGVPPDGVSHLDYRHDLFKAALDRHPFPETLLHRAQDVPPTFNRLAAIARRAKDLPAKEVYVMDSGMAAILGATMDVRARLKEKIVVIDVATSHTVGAALRNDELYGFFEYHTRDMTCQKLERLVRGLENGTLDHRRMLQEGGHGAYVRKALGVDAAELIVVTGPRRKMVRDTRLPMTCGAPLGDNMMTGTVGLLEAVRRHKKLDPLTYL